LEEFLTEAWGMTEGHGEIEEGTWRGRRTDPAGIVEGKKRFKGFGKSRRVSEISHKV
jgi:hypothetical protein